MATKKNRSDIAERGLIREKRALEKKEKARIRRKWHFGTFGHFLTVLFTLILSVVVLVVMVAGQFFLGPSQSASDLLTQTLMESSALKFVPYLFLYEHVDEALERNKVVASDHLTDTSLVTVKAHVLDAAVEADDAETFDENGVRIEKVVGPTFYGQMMIVKDPSRVSVGVCSNPFHNDKPGKYVNEIIDAYGALGGINGGAFADSGGGGTGGEALGMVFSDGQKMRGANAGYPTVVGFDKDDILHVGNYTNAQADEVGFRDAVSFGPALVINGEPSVVSGNSSGLNPRSAIGQRADGAVLLLVIDGRQANSMGASYADLIKVMLDFGAVNACNLDGGSSTIMFYKGEKLNDGMTISASRRMPTAWIVK